ncbi:MAG TPA: class I SAM-dependent methyltransferase [Ignavibacteria bacterium]|nr:class I SAM-dependent methyltransferase [Ignavibacteria bacterium]
MKCKICDNTTEFFGKGKILEKYEIDYFKCPNCRFIQTENPYWLDEAYKDPINRSDVGYVFRNIRLAKVLNLLIYISFNRKSKFLDYGAGYGLFVRLMRDYGYDFYWDDLYCENIFSKDFEIKDSLNTEFELISAFELFEHLNNPLEEIEKILKYSRNIFISTELYPVSNPSINSWWYFGLEHGQHIALYSKQTFEYIAKKFNLNFYTDGKNIHLLSEKKINRIFFKLLGYYYKIISRKKFKILKPLLDEDHKSVIKKIENEKLI